MAAAKKLGVDVGRYELDTAAKPFKDAGVMSDAEAAAADAPTSLSEDETGPRCR